MNHSHFGFVDVRVFQDVLPCSLGVGNDDLCCLNASLKEAIEVRDACLRVALRDSHPCQIVDGCHECRGPHYWRAIVREVIYVTPW